MPFLLQKLVLQPGTLSTKVLCLTQVVTTDELKDDEDYEDILEDMRMECGKFGKRLHLNFIILFFYLIVNFCSKSIDLNFLPFVLCLCFTALLCSPALLIRIVLIC